MPKKSIKWARKVIVAVIGSTLLMAGNLHAVPKFAEAYFYDQGSESYDLLTLYGAGGQGPAIHQTNSKIPTIHSNAVSLWEQLWSNPLPLKFFTQNLTPAQIDTALETANSSTDFFTALGISTLYTNAADREKVFQWFVLERERRQNMRRDGIYVKSGNAYIPTRRIDITPHLMGVSPNLLTTEDENALIDIPDDNTPWLHRYEDSVNANAAANRNTMGRVVTFLMVYYQADYFTTAREISTAMPCWGFSSSVEDCGVALNEPSDQFYKLYDAMVLAVKTAQTALGKDLAIYPTWDAYYADGCLGDLDPVVGTAIQKLNAINEHRGVKFNIGISLYPVKCVWHGYGDARESTQNQIRGIITGVKVAPATNLTVPLSDGTTLTVTPQDAVINGAVTDVVIGETSVDDWSMSIDNFDGEDYRQALRFDHYYHLATEFYKSAWPRPRKPPVDENGVPYPEPAITGFNLSHVISAGAGPWNAITFPVRQTDAQGTDYYTWVRSSASLSLPLIYGGGQASDAAVYLDSVIYGNDYDGDGINQIAVNPSGTTPTKYHPYTDVLCALPQNHGIACPNATLHVSWTRTDNCPYISNSSQSDTDGDGIGDACDNSISIANRWQEDFDQDGMGNATDADFDNNGTINNADLAILQNCILTATAEGFPAVDCADFATGGYAAWPQVTDMTGDGKVNSDDMARFNSLCSNPATGCTINTASTGYSACAGKRKFDENGAADIAISTKRYNKVCPSAVLPVLPNDSDGDGILNSAETTSGFMNPDVNSDGVADGIIVDYKSGSTWLTAADGGLSATLDGDADGRVDVQEAKIKTECAAKGYTYNPKVQALSTDTDGDGLTDSNEILASHTVTISNGAGPAVITKSNHLRSINDPVVFTTTGNLRNGLTVGTTYYVKQVQSSNTFTVSATIGGAAITTSGTQSGVHTMKYIGGGTNPCMKDTDVDGMTDKHETTTVYSVLDWNGNPTTTKTNPLHNDSDYDGLSDGDEAFIKGTRPWDCDSDEDMFNDGFEFNNGTLPLDYSSVPSQGFMWGCAWWRTGGNNMGL